MNFHCPVLLSETIESLSVIPKGIYIDATLGHGGHTLEILKRGGVVYGFDQDPSNLEIATQRIKDLGLGTDFHPIHANFSRIQEIFNNEIKTKADGLLADLGLSQNQQTDQNRGFSFNDTTSLDMRLDPSTQELTAEEIINTYSFEELYEIFTKFGQELYSKPIIFQIIKERQKTPIRSGKILADIIRKYYREHHLRTKIDPATKIFLSLRITVNQENSHLTDLLNQTLAVVKSNGTVAIITFHSGEDRLVKQFIVQNSSKITNPKITKPTFSEIQQNPLSRSSILRSYKIV